MNILAVDDEYYALELMKRALEEVAVGATVYLCRDVKSALHTGVAATISEEQMDMVRPNSTEKAMKMAYPDWEFDYETFVKFDLGTSKQFFCR